MSWFDRKVRVKNVELLLLLCNIYNMSFTTGIVPNKLKIAKNNPEYIENYRPVALISIFAKLLEINV